jgi:hypothetical protein
MFLTLTEFIRWRKWLPAIHGQAWLLAGSHFNLLWIYSDSKCTLRKGSQPGQYCQLAVWHQEPPASFFCSPHVLS